MATTALPLASDDLRPLFAGVRCECGWSAPEELMTQDLIDSIAKDYHDDTRVLALLTQRDVLIEAMKMIAGQAPCIDNLMGDKDIARAAIAAVKGEKK